MVGTLQFLGDSTLKFEAIRVHNGPKGTSCTFRVTCPLLANLITYHNYLIGRGANVTFLGIDGGYERALEVEVPGLVDVASGLLDELFFDQWEMPTNQLSESIFANPLIVGGASPVLNYNDKTVLSRMARVGGTIADAVASCNDDITASGLTAPNPSNGGTSDNEFQIPSSAASAQIALEIVKGQTEYGKPSRVLRHTSYCSASSSYNAATSGENLIYTTANLLAEISSGWTYNCPYRLRSKISGIAVEYAPGDESAYYLWGWKKEISRESVLANFMVETSVEYELGLWSTLRYGVY